MCEETKFPTLIMIVPAPDVVRSGVKVMLPSSMLRPQPGVRLLSCERIASALSKRGLGASTTCSQCFGCRRGDVGDRAHSLIDIPAGPLQLRGLLGCGEWQRHRATCGSDSLLRELVVVDWLPRLPESRTPCQHITILVLRYSGSVPVCSLPNIWTGNAGIREIMGLLMCLS